MTDHGPMMVQKFDSTDERDAWLRKRADMIAGAATLTAATLGNNVCRAINGAIVEAIRSGVEAIDVRVGPLAHGTSDPDIVSISLAWKAVTLSDEPTWPECTRYLLRAPT